MKIIKEELVTAPIDIIKKFIYLLHNYGYELDSEYAKENPYITHRGTWHIQVINFDHPVTTDEEMIKYANQLGDAIEEFEAENDTPITWSFGKNPNGFITCGIDVLKVRDGWGQTLKDERQKHECFSHQNNTYSRLVRF